MNCAPEDVIMRDDRVWKRGTAESDHDPTASEMLEKIRCAARAESTDRFCGDRCCRSARKKVPRTT